MTDEKRDGENEDRETAEDSGAAPDSDGEQREETAQDDGGAPPKGEDDPPLRPEDFPDSAFDGAFEAQDIANEIKALRGRTLDEIGKFFDYYDRGARGKKYASRLYRTVAITATVLAGILIVLSHQDIAAMFSTSDHGDTKTITSPAPGVATTGKPIGKPKGANSDWSVADLFPIPGGWAILLGLIAGAAIGADRMSGTSKNWMRYVLARQELEAIRHRYEKRLLTAEMSGKALFLIAVCRKALEEVDDIVFEETKQWVRDYREDLEQLQQAVSKFRPSGKKPGG